MPTPITINGDTSQYFIAENVTSITKSVGMDGSYDMTVYLSSDVRHFVFPDEASLDAAILSLSTTIEESGVTISALYASLPTGLPAGTRGRATDGKGFDVVYDGTAWIPDYAVRINVQSGTSYTLTDADNGTVIRFTNNSPITLTANSAQAVIGFNCLIEQAGTGQITLAGTATKNNIYSATRSGGQYAMCSLTCSVAGSFNFGGDVV